MGSSLMRENGVLITKESWSLWVADGSLTELSV